MGCDYYVYTQLIIESYNNEIINKKNTQTIINKLDHILYKPILNNIISYLYYEDDFYFNINSIEIELNRGYIYGYDYFGTIESDEESEEDYNDKLYKILDEINKIPIKILYENDKWLKSKYEDKYKYYIPEYLLKTKLFRIYIKKYAKERL